MNVIVVAKPKLRRMQPLNLVTALHQDKISTLELHQNEVKQTGEEFFARDTADFGTVILTSVSIQNHYETSQPDQVYV